MGSADEFLQLIEGHLDDYPVLVFEEFVHAHGELFDKFCFLGCGALPCTAFFFDFYRYWYDLRRQADIQMAVNAYKRTRQLNGEFKQLLYEYIHHARLRPPFVILDRSATALDLATKFFSKAQIRESVQALCIDAREWIPPSDHSIFVHIASMVEPRQETIDKLFTRLVQLKQPARILLRHTSRFDLRSVLYETLSEHTVDNLIEKFSLRLVSKFRPDTDSDIVTGFTVLDAPIDSRVAVK